MEDKIESLKKDFAYRGQRIDDLEEDNEELKKENADLRSKLDYLESRIVKATSNGLPFITAQDGRLINLAAYQSFDIERLLAGTAGEAARRYIYQVRAWNGSHWDAIFQSELEEKCLDYLDALRIYTMAGEYCDLDDADDTFFRKPE